MSRESRRLRGVLQHTNDNLVDYEGDYSIKFGTAAEYENSFREVLGGDTLQGLLEKWDPKDVAALDLMGYGEVLHELNVQHGLAVALSDARAETRRAMHGANIQVIPGNVLESSTWHAIDNWLQTKAPDDRKFKLILARPISGVNTMPTLPESLVRKYSFAIVNRLWRRLSSQDGEMFVQSLDQFDELLPAWIDVLNKTPGIHAAYRVRGNKPGYYGFDPKDVRVEIPELRLTKHDDAPEQLPFSRKIR